MKKLFTGLCMAWGNFCFIPGVKKWDENARSLMLGWLPLIGIVIGGLWALIYFGLVYASMPYLLVTFIMAFLPFFLSGFIHVDGFMDCNDAMLSRGTLEKKQSILKDSRCGTFAVVTLIFTALCFYSSLGSAISYGIDFVNLIAITAISRSVSGLEVLLSRPMASSQYAAMAAEYEDDENDPEFEPEEETQEGQNTSDDYDYSLTGAQSDTTYVENISAGDELIPAQEETGIQENTAAETTAKTEEESKVNKPATIQQGVFLLVAQLILVLAFVLLFCKYYLVTALVVAGTTLGTLISCTIAKKSLGGMNGDIAGYSIIWGEMIGVIMLALV